MHIEIGTLAAIYEVDTHKQFFEDEIRSFLQTHHRLLRLDTSEQTQHLWENWSQKSFETLLEMLCFRGWADRVIATTAPLQPVESDQIGMIRTSIFESHSTQALMEKFIRPKARMEASIDYGYSEQELRHFADFTMNPEAAYVRLQLLSDSGVFLHVGKDHSPERLRRERKTALEVMFLCLLRHPTFADAELHHEIFQSADAARQFECQLHMDAEYGSVHHVLYGMISGTSDYCVEPWLNEKSRFGYLTFVVPALQLLAEVS